jgi:hypothetical protein
MENAQFTELRLNKTQEEKLTELTIKFFRRKKRKNDDYIYIKEVPYSEDVELKVVNYDDVIKRERGTGDIIKMDSILDMPWYEFCMTILPIAIFSKINPKKYDEIDSTFFYDYKPDYRSIILDKLINHEEEHIVDYLYDFVVDLTSRKLFVK